MKISNASKKVLASALSAAMVVAFAPTVAFGAQGGANHKITVEYDLAGGYDSATDTQTQVKNAEYTVADTVVAAEKYAAEEAAKHNAALDGNVKAGDIKKNLADFDDIYVSVKSTASGDGRDCPLRKTGKFPHLSAYGAGIFPYMPRFCPRLFRGGGP